MLAQSRAAGGFVLQAGPRERLVAGRRMDYMTLRTPITLFTTCTV